MARRWKARNIKKAPRPLRPRGIRAGFGLEVHQTAQDVGITFHDDRIIPGQAGPDRGACCLGDSQGTCVADQTEQECDDEGGRWLGSGTNCGPPNPCVGACCLGPNQSVCVPAQTEVDCLAEGGEWKGPGVSCVPNPCEIERGACCFGTNCVADQTQAECLGEGGQWQGADVPCMPNPCIDPPDGFGACCVEATCVPNQTAESCCLLEGDFQGVGVPCTPNPCSDGTGACCTGENFVTCVPNVTRGQCCVMNSGKGHWLGDGSGCGPPNPCTQDNTTGACCFGDFPQACLENQTQTQCAAQENSQWFPGQACTPPECMIEPTLGACCFGDVPQQCEDDRTAAQCAIEPASQWFPGQACTPPQCLGEETIGACCVAGVGGLCLDGLTNAECTNQCSGCLWFAGQLCTPAECMSDPPTMGACCSGPFAPDQQCVVNTAIECAALPMGNWHGGVLVCNPLPGDCVGEPPTGACCPSPGGVPCVITTQALCTGDYLGDGTNCGPPDPCVEAVVGVCCIGPAPPGGQETCQPADDQASCIAQGGTWHPGIPNCGPPNPCPFGPALEACCMPETGLPGQPEDCFDFEAQDCIALGGLPQGPGTNCTPNLCPIHPPHGACCFPNPIPPPGAQQQCVDDIHQAECLAGGGAWQGNNTTCTPNPCPVTRSGACCFGEQCVSNLTQQECEDQDGEWKGAGNAGDPCNPNPCIEDTTAGACCVPGLAPDDSPGSPQTCVDGVSKKRCERLLHGDFQGAGTTCNEIDCGTTGACCIGDQGSCIDNQTQKECEAENGIFQGIGTMCDEVDCVIGACCCGPICVQTTEENCLSPTGICGFPGTWHGPVPCKGVVCIGNPLVDCCLAPPSCDCISSITDVQCIAMGGIVKPLETCSGGGCCGACCQFDAGCINNQQEEECHVLVDNVWLGPGTGCDTGFFCKCCCVNAICVKLNEVSCLAAGGAPIEPCPSWPPGCGTGGPC